MKKLYILCLVILGLNVTAKSQNYIVQGGFNCYLFPSNYYNSTFNQILITPNIFLFQETDLTKTFSVIAGIGINGKGIKKPQDWWWYELSEEKYYRYTSYYYFEIPLLVNFKYPINEKYKLFGKFGPSLGLLFLGSSIYSYQDVSGNKTWDSYTEFFGNLDDLFEINLNCCIGLEMNKYLFELKYGMGFNFPGGYDSFNNGISLSFGYKFKTK